jgi:hypothetical protein
MFASAQSRALRIDLPQIDPPPGSTWFWVSNKMSYNGLAMTVRKFEYFGTEADVERYYSDLWHSMGFGTRSSQDLGPVRVMSFEQRGAFISVQFAQEGSWVKGKIVVSENPDQRKPSFKTTLPVMPGAVVANVIESLDGDQHTESVTLETSKPVDFVRRFYESQLDSRGFQRVFVSNSETDDGVLMQYQKGSAQLQITIKNPHGNDRSGSHVLIHLTQ